MCPSTWARGLARQVGLGRERRVGQARPSSHVSSSSLPWEDGLQRQQRAAGKRMSAVGRLAVAGKQAGRLAGAGRQVVAGRRAEVAGKHRFVAAGRHRFEARKWSKGGNRIHVLGDLGLGFELGILGHKKILYKTQILSTLNIRCHGAHHKVLARYICCIKICDKPLHVSVL